MLNPKIKYWEKRLKQLEQKDLPAAIQRIINARRGGWWQNAEFEEAGRQIEIIKLRIEEIKQLLRKLTSGER
jgi:transcription elongation GreA/GreB family factor